MDIKGRLTRCYGYLMQAVKDSDLLRDARGRFYVPDYKGSLHRVIRGWKGTCREWKKQRLADKNQRRLEYRRAKRAAACHLQGL